MSNTLFRAIVGPISPIYKAEEAPVIYRLTLEQQMAMIGSAQSGPSEAETLITNDPANIPSFPS